MWVRVFLCGGGTLSRLACWGFPQPGFWVTWKPCGCLQGVQAGSTGQVVYPGVWLSLRALAIFAFYLQSKRSRIIVEDSPKSETKSYRYSPSILLGICVRFSRVERPGRLELGPFKESFFTGSRGVCVCVCGCVSLSVPWVGVEAKCEALHPPRHMLYPRMSGKPK